MNSQRSSLYPCKCIVWTPLPPLTWIFPFIGHVGIVDSSGGIHDFQGPYYVNQGRERMAFGDPVRYLELHREVSDTEWDAAIQEADQVYCGRMHNLLCDNCHSHVCNALNRLNAIERSTSNRWNMVKLAALIFFFGRYAGWQGVIKTWLPFIVIISIIIILISSLSV
ncbi:hypothetical protein MIR68_002874 [Amoeboaphelidium protococcarum]|nr:hypothetical protein MIR68_002874 [Amoeboaphelidium protococcarum]